MQNKEQILRASREKGQVTYTGKPIRITPEFSMETMKARRSWIYMLQTMNARPDYYTQHSFLSPLKEKTRYFMTKTDLNNMYPQTQS